MKRRPRTAKIHDNIQTVTKARLKRAVLSTRRFKKKGGIKGAMARLLYRLKKRDRHTIRGLCLTGFALAMIVCLPIVFGGGRKAAMPAEGSVLQEAGANMPNTAESGVMSIEDQYAAIQAEAAAREAAAGPTPRPVYFQTGFENEDIASIQQRLMDLSYMDNDEPTNFFGPNTEDAVELFQRRHGLTITGVIDKAAYNLLFSDEALPYMVCNGISGTDVEELQARLRELDYLDKATGYFGDETEAAVKEFQKNNKLTQDGKVGEHTREMLYSEDAVARSISYGEKSDDVYAFQKRLKKLGYLTAEPDGTFGKATVKAVKMFQEQNGLMVDGHIGPMTKELLRSGSAKSCVISIGARNDTVTKIQERLRALGYLKSHATGYFGSSTESAVIGFQKRNNLSRDGKVGTTTMNALFSSKAKKAPSDYKAPSASSSSSGGSSSGSGSAIVGDAGSLDRFISAAKSKIGCKYVRGAKGPSRFDCSGFVYWCLKEAGINQKYLTSSGWRSVGGYEKVTSVHSLRRGDIIVFKGHVGIALGDGSMIDASSGNGKVVHRSCTGDWSIRNFICGWRMF